MLASRRLPAPLMSTNSRANPVRRGQGPAGSKFFCPGAGLQKVAGRCTQYWWIVADRLAKSLILEQNSITNCLDSSIKLQLLSIKCLFLSTTAFFGLGPSSLSFSFVNKEERERKASIKENRQSIKSTGRLFFNPSVLLRISRIWWILMDVKSNIFKRLPFNPSKSTNPPVFSPTPP